MGRSTGAQQAPEIYADACTGVCCTTPTPAQASMGPGQQPVMAGGACRRQTLTFGACVGPHVSLTSTSTSTPDRTDVNVKANVKVRRASVMLVNVRHTPTSTSGTSAAGVAADSDLLLVAFT